MQRSKNLLLAIRIGNSLFLSSPFRLFFESESHFHSFALKKRAIRSKKIRSFHLVFDSFSHFYAQERNISVALCSLTLKKEQKNYSLKNMRESLFRSFAHKKRVIRSKNQRGIPNPEEVTLMHLYLNSCNFVSQPEQQ